MELWIFIAAIYLIYLLFFKKKKINQVSHILIKLKKRPPASGKRITKTVGIMWLTTTVKMMRLKLLR